MRNRALPFNYAGANIASRYIACLSFRGPRSDRYFEVFRLIVKIIVRALWSYRLRIGLTVNDSRFLGNLKKMEIENIYTQWFLSKMEMQIIYDNFNNGIVIWNG